jgi:hypothetical protein
VLKEQGFVINLLQMEHFNKDANLSNAFIDDGNLPAIAATPH